MDLSLSTSVQTQQPTRLSPQLGVELSTTSGHSPSDDAPWPAQTPPLDWTDIVSELGPKPGDFLITKHQWGAFHGTELDLQLRRRGITTIVLCGIATNIGVESTARFAFEYGYNQIFVEDAMSALSVEEHTFTVFKILPRLGLVRRTKELLSGMSPV